jgi:penicillin-binding protein 1A
MTRAGKVELGRFEDERRRVLAFDSIPTTILDATTSAEEPDLLGQPRRRRPRAPVRRGRQRLRHERPRRVDDHAAAGTGAPAAGFRSSNAVADRYVRKVKEIIQSVRVNEAYPGEAGKQRVITAYLNEIFYGHGAYGIAAAAEIYFGVHDLSKLTVAQAALLAGLPKAPTSLDPYRFAKRDKKGRLVVPPTSSHRSVRRDGCWAGWRRPRAGASRMRPPREGRTASR